MAEIRIVVKIPAESPLGEVLGPMRNRAAITRDALVFYLTATGRLGARIPLPSGPLPGTGDNGAVGVTGLQGQAADTGPRPSTAVAPSDGEWNRRVGGFDLGGLGGG